MKKILLSLVAAAALFGCCKAPEVGYQPDKSVCVGPNSLTLVNVGPTKVLTRDFVVDPSRVDSVTSEDPALAVALSEDKLALDFYCGEEMHPMTTIKLWVDGVAYAVPVRKSDKFNYTFTYNPNGCKIGRIQIAGQMNNWVPALTPDLTLNEEGLYEVTMLLSPGTYLYQLLIDGDQNHDDTNPNKVDNGFGKFNSIMQVNGNEDKFPKLLTDELGCGRFVVKAEATERVWAYWNNVALDERFVTFADGKITVKVPAEAAACAKSVIRVWASNEFGISNEILVPLYNGKIVTDAAELDRSDKYAQIIYFMLVDRFRDGNPDNNRPMNRPDVHPRADYHGGDLAGIKQVIDEEYFNKLGANTLWLSPLNQNPFEPYGYNALADTKFAGYHGYWPISSSQVDCRFGTNDELKELVADAHDHEINILLDYVANHVHQDHPLFKRNPEYATPLYLPDGRMNTELWDEHRLTTWFDVFMPTLDMGNPEVVDIMVDSAVYWLKEFGVDGFRHDACKHVNEEYWRELTHRMKLTRPEGNFYQIGESYGSPELIASYVNSGMLDGQFDFNVFDEATSAFNGVSGGTMTRLSNVLNSSLKVYGAHNLMGYVSGNHDKPRFMALASGDIKVGEDAKAAGWTRTVGITDSVAYDKLALLHAFNLTIPGVPVIYYGDEIGMTGGNDPDCRRMMRFGDWNNREEALFEKVAALNHLRRGNMALVYGDYMQLHVAEQTLAYARKYFDKSVVVCINNSTEPQTFELDITALGATNYKALFGNNCTIKGNTLTVELPALTAEVYY